MSDGAFHLQFWVGRQTLQSRDQALFVCGQPCVGLSQLCLATRFCCFITSRTYTITPERYSHPCQCLRDILQARDLALSSIRVVPNLDSDKMLRNLHCQVK